MRKLVLYINIFYISCFDNFRFWMVIIIKKKKNENNDHLNEGGKMINKFRPLIILWNKCFTNILTICVEI